MTVGEVLLNLYIDANILVIIAYSLWCIGLLLPERFGIKYAYSTQLRLLNSFFLAIAFTPIVAFAYSTLFSAGLIGQTNLNLSEIAIAKYLDGSIRMKAGDLENLIMIRENFIQNLLAGSGWVALIISAFFVIGVLAGLLRITCSLYCLRRIVTGGYRLRTIGRLRICLSDKVLVPFATRGLRNYYVVLPYHILEHADELKVSLAHEFQHIRRGDLEWEILLEMLKPFFFLNPAYHAWKRQVENLRELACDREVLLRGRIDVNVYCSTLLAVCRRTLRRDRDRVYALPKVTLVTAGRGAATPGKRSFLEQRILSLLDTRAYARKKITSTAMFLPMIIIIFLTAVLIQKPRDWSHDRIMLATVVNLDRLTAMNQRVRIGQVFE